MAGAVVTGIGSERAARGAGSTGSEAAACPNTAEEGTKGSNATMSVRRQERGLAGLQCIESDELIFSGVEMSVTAGEGLMRK